MTPDSSARPTVLVLGGSGFIGRHVVAALLARGSRVVVGSRHPERVELIGSVANGCQRRRTSFRQLLTPGDWRDLLDGIDVAVNCVGLLRERGRDTYERVHHQAPAALAGACALTGTRLIHVSALGLEAPAQSRFLLTKRAGEKAIRSSDADWCIVRPSLLDGDGGFGAGWLRRVARWPVHPVPTDAAGRIAVLDVRDLAVAIAALARRHGPRPDADRELDLGGSDARTLAEHLAALRRLHTAGPAFRLRVPSALARLGSHLCDLLHVTPFSFGHWELLRRDNLPGHNRLPELLGRQPRPVGAAGVGTTATAPTGSRIRSAAPLATPTGR